MVPPPAGRGEENEQGKKHMGTVEDPTGPGTRSSCAECSNCNRTFSDSLAAHHVSSRMSLTGPFDDLPSSEGADTLLPRSEHRTLRPDPWPQHAVGDLEPQNFVFKSETAVRITEPLLKKAHADTYRSEERVDKEQTSGRDDVGQGFEMRQCPREEKYVRNAPGSQTSFVEGHASGMARLSQPCRDDVSTGKITPSGCDDTSAQDEEDHASENSRQGHRTSMAIEATRTTRKHASRDGRSEGVDGILPAEQSDLAEDYSPQPQRYRRAILGAVLALFFQPSDYDNDRGSNLRSGNYGVVAGRTEPSPTNSPSKTGASTPTDPPRQSLDRRNTPKHKDTPSPSLALLVDSSISLTSPSVAGVGAEGSRHLEVQRHSAKRPGDKLHGHSNLHAFHHTSRSTNEEDLRITIHVAETIYRQLYLMRLCRALMEYGAPTHRLEEYLNMSARVLEIEAQFLYIPGSMIMSFDDPSTHTTDVKLVKVAPGLDLGKLRDTHEVYKRVVHDMIGVEEATEWLKEVSRCRPKHNKWTRIFVFGLASACVGPFAFGARLIDLPIAFLLGCLLGVLQLVVAPRSDSYANVFEICTAVLTSFLSRAFGSINEGNLFCFSALAQSSIALILPGYTVLCASLELQSRSIVAGSVRMVYAIIYSLFLGFGITIGTAIYSIIDSSAVSTTQCKDPTPQYWSFVFVPAFTMCLIIINQAKRRQAPVMMVISFAGYIVNYLSSQRFNGNTQVSNTLGALAIGVLANLNSRVGSRIENMSHDFWEDTLRPRLQTYMSTTLHVKTKNPETLRPRMGEDLGLGNPDSALTGRDRCVGYGLAAAAMLPAIFVQVPSGLSVSGSLVSGITSANEITDKSANHSMRDNTTSTANTSGTNMNALAFNVGYSVIQVAIGITVGLFLSAVVIYPFGKKRSGLFSL